MLDPKIRNLEIISVDSGSRSRQAPLVQKLITQQYKLKELQLSLMYSLSNIALPVKRLSFALTTNCDTQYLSILSDCLRKSKNTLEVLEMTGVPTNEMMSVIMDDLKRLKALGLDLRTNCDRSSVYDQLTPNKSIETLVLSGIVGLSFLSDLLKNLPNVKRFCCALMLTQKYWKVVSMNMKNLEEIHFTKIDGKHFSDLKFPSVKTISFETSNIFLECTDQLRVSFANVENLKIFSRKDYFERNDRCHELLAIKDHWPQLRTVELGKGFKITVTEIKDLYDRRPLLESVKLSDESIVMKSSVMLENEMETLKKLHKKGLHSVECPKFDYRKEFLNLSEPAYTGENM